MLRPGRGCAWSEVSMSRRWSREAASRRWCSGITEVLSRHAARLAFYRPFVTSADAPDPAIELIRHRYRVPDARLGSALTADDLRNLDGRDSTTTRCSSGC